MRAEANLPVSKKIKTAGEVTFNFLKAAAIPTAIAMLGINPLDGVGAVVNEIKNNLVEGPGAFMTGMSLGLVKNVISYAKVIDNLKKSNGIEPPTRVIKISPDNSEAVAQISCVDIRRKDKSGGAMPGAYAMFGSEITSLILAAGVGAVTPDSNPVSQFLVGYNVGANLFTEGSAIFNLYNQIRMIHNSARIQSGNQNVRVKIEMMDHWDGCGAQGATGILNYIAKFKWHNKGGVADILGIPNEVFGYMLVNSLSWAIGLGTGGRISLSAVEKRSKMHKKNTH